MFSIFFNNVIINITRFLYPIKLYKKLFNKYLFPIIVCFHNFRHFRNNFIMAYYIIFIDFIDIIDNNKLLFYEFSNLSQLLLINCLFAIISIILLFFV